MMREPSRTVADIAERLLAGHETPHQLTLRVEDCTFCVRSNSSELIAVLADYYRDFVVALDGSAEVGVTFVEAPPPRLDLPFVPYPPGPGKTRIKDELLELDDGRLVRKRLTGMAFLFGPANNIGVGPCLANANQAVNFINNRFIQRTLDRGSLLCHAAGVAKNGIGIAIAGTAGAGKSTLALHLMRHDLDFVSNDRLMIQRKGTEVEMLGLAKLPRINPGTILNNPNLVKMLTPEQRARYERLAPEELWTLEEKFDGDIERCFGPGRMRLRAKMAAFMVLDWRRDAGPAKFDRVNLADRPELLDAIMKRAGAHYWAPSGRSADTAGPAAYLEALADCPIIEVSGGVDFDAAVDKGLAILGETAHGPIAVQDGAN